MRKRLRCREISSAKRRPRHNAFVTSRLPTTHPLVLNPAGVKEDLYSLRQTHHSNTDSRRRTNPIQDEIDTELLESLETFYESLLNSRFNSLTVFPHGRSPARRPVQSMLQT